MQALPVTSIALLTAAQRLRGALDDQLSVLAVKRRVCELLATPCHRKLQGWGAPKSKRISDLTNVKQYQDSQPSPSFHYPTI